MNSEHASVLFVDIPGVSQWELTIPVHDLTLSRLSIGTRVWVRGNPYGWYAAEIVGWGGSGRYHIRISGLDHEIPNVDAERFTVRANRPLTDPVTAVAYGLCESPVFYEARRDFLDHLVAQRRVSRGLTAALSAAVALYPHQLDTAARVLADPVLRYLLADEVGLGKTIEAGLVVRQLLLDDPQATALVLAPSELVAQWEQELQDRLLLGEQLRRRRVRVVPHHTSGDEVLGLHRHAVVVVDETHRLLSKLRGQSPVRGALLRAQGLLLLSATPMRDSTEKYLDLVSLVDPVAFPRDDIESFRVRIQNREQEANSLQILTSRRATTRNRLAALDQIADAHQGDPAVKKLANRCRAAADAGDPAWASLAHYVRETYRISRRMIRNRRDGLTTRDYPVTGRQATFHPVDDPARFVIDNFLDKYRDHLADSRRNEARPTNEFGSIVLHALGGPCALRHHLETRLAVPAGEPRCVSADDRTMFETTVARLALTDIGARFVLALGIIDQRLEETLRIVVVSSSTRAARDFLSEAQKRWPDRVGAHLTDTSDSLREHEVHTFLNSTDGRILVGDFSLEEGRNLQAAEVLINLDLPIDPNRLEQRIGRLDRHGRRAEPAEVVVITEPTSEWVSAQIHFLHEGVRIFNRSVSTLQRKLAQIRDEIVDQLVGNGSGAFELDVNELRNELDQEQDDVDLLEELESVATASDFDGDAVAELHALDDDVPRLREAFRRLATPDGGFALWPQETAQGLLNLGARRQQRIYGLPEDLGRELIPLLKQLRTYDRRIASERPGVSPLRLGDSLVEWLREYLTVDERGRARAIVRRHPGTEVPKLWLACDFLVEFDASHISAENDAVRRRLRRRGDALYPPTVLRTWTDPAGPADDPGFVRAVLERPFDAESDVVIRGTVWSDVLSALPDWKALCEMSGGEAITHVRSLPELTTAPADAAQRAADETGRRLAVLGARSMRLPSDAERAGARREMERETELGRSMRQGVERPAVSTIACGAVVLWPTS